jgi:hypothetical protein
MARICHKVLPQPLSQASFRFTTIKGKAQPVDVIDF